MVTLEIADQTLVQGYIIGDYFRFEKEIQFNSGAMVVIDDMVLSGNSSAIFSGGSTCRSNQLTSRGSLTFAPSCDVTYTMLSVSSSSRVVFESDLGATIPARSTVALSGSLRGLKLIVKGSLVIPAFSNVLLDTPLVADAETACIILVIGNLTIASYVQSKTCNVSGSGHLTIQNGINSANVSSISVNRVSIAKMFVVLPGDVINFTSAAVDLISCVASVSGSVISNSLSHFVLSSDSSLNMQNAAVTDFKSMTIHGSFSFNNSIVNAADILFAEESRSTCVFSTVRAKNMLVAGVLCSCSHARARMSQPW